MIATLTGTVQEILHDTTVLNVAGVGYGLFLTNEDKSTTSVGAEVKMYVHEHIREQSHDLFGFTSLESKQLFEQLLSVKNVGPKVALAILDIGNSSVVRAAIAGGDVKLLQSAKGVGKRAAEQVVVELRDKVGLSASDVADSIINRPGTNSGDEAVEALVSLGYAPQDAALALRDINTELPVEERVTLALKRRG